MTREETRARKMFRKVQVGHDYEWRNQEDELHILRVTAKRLTVGKNPRCEVSGVFFFLHAQTGEPCGEGIPAYSDTWNRIGPVLLKWKGTRPHLQSIHAEWHCEACDRRIEFTGSPISPCCHDNVYKRRLYKGEHDNACLCEECEHEYKISNRRKNLDVPS